MNDYKTDIINTRKGCLGGSDAKLLMQISLLGFIPQSAHKRLAVVKGLTEAEQFTNDAIRFGDYIENCVYESLKSQDERWQSNPCLVSDKYSRKNVKCIDHVDYMLVDDENKTITIGECKGTRLSYAQTRNEYDAQLQHHYMLGEEYAKKFIGYKVKVLLCHYSTDGIDLSQPFEFDPSRLTVKPIRFSKPTYDLAKAMDLVDEFLETFDEYYESDEIDSAYLPEKVKQEFDLVTGFIADIKVREKKVAEFKEKLCSFMQEKGIKSIKNDLWSITLVNESVAVSFDSKAFLRDYATEHPQKYKKLVKTYEKRQNKKAYVTINLKGNKE